MKVLFKASEEAKAIPSQEDLFDLMREVNRQQKALHILKSYVDVYMQGKVTLTSGNDDFDAINHVYDISVYMGIMADQICKGLGLSNPNITKGRRKLE